MRLSEQTRERFWWVILLGGGSLLYVGLASSTPDLKRPAVPVDIALMQQLLQPPDWNPAGWEAFCSQRRRCVMTAEVSCPPDCGVYKLLIEDRLLRRIW